MIEDLSEGDRVLSEGVGPSARLRNDEWMAFVSIGAGFAAHDTIHHKGREYALTPVHINSAEGSEVYRANLARPHLKRTASRRLTKERG